MCEVLQFGGTQITALQSLRNEFSIQSMPLVTEEVNMFVLLHSLLRLKLSRWSYYNSFCCLSQSKVVIVWHDNNVHAYLLKRALKIPIVCVQNGLRHNLSSAGDIGFLSALETLKSSISPHVDDYWIFGEASQQLLQSSIRAGYHIHGSFRANEYAATRQALIPNSEKRRIGLIVSFPNASDVPGGYILNNPEPFFQFNGSVISYHEWFKFDEIVCRAVSQIADECSLDCAVIAKRHGEDTLESHYFAKVFERQRIPVIGHEKGAGYELADSFDYLVATESTLGYEMLGLGSRVAFVSGRLLNIGIETSELRFGWPLELPEHGPFWTTSSNGDEIVNFLRQFLKLDDSVWQTSVGDIAKRVMAVDRGNSALRRSIAAYVGRN